MRILRQYQLDIIFLFFALIVKLWTYFYILKNLGLDPHQYEWYAAGPLIAFYLWYLLKRRQNIALSDRRQMTTKSLFYWIALGLIVIGTHTTPISADTYWSLKIFFWTFTILLADSYWDFRTLTWRSLKK